VVVDYPLLLLSVLLAETSLALAYGLHSWVEHLREHLALAAMVILVSSITTAYGYLHQVAVERLAAVRLAALVKVATLVQDAAAAAPAAVSQARLSALSDVAALLHVSSLSGKQ
jgi:hypothetical protein